MANRRILRGKAFSYIAFAGRDERRRRDSGVARLTPARVAGPLLAVGWLFATTTGDFRRACAFRGCPWRRWLAG